MKKLADTFGFLGIAYPWIEGFIYNNEMLEQLGLREQIGDITWVSMLITFLLSMFVPTMIREEIKASNTMQTFIIYEFATITLSVFGTFEFIIRNTFSSPSLTDNPWAVVGVLLSNILLFQIGAIFLLLAFYFDKKYKEQQ